MKKVCLLLVIVCAAVSANAQLYVGGALNFSQIEKSNVKTTTFGLLPEVGYSINDKFAVGSILGFSYAKTDVKGSEEATTFQISPYARYSFYQNDLVRLFLDGGFDFESFKQGDDDGSTFAFGVRPGIAVKLSDKISLKARYGFLGYADKEDFDGTKGFGLDLDGTELDLGIFYTF